MVAAGFLSLFKWSLNIYPMPYNHKQNVLNESLNKIIPSFIRCSLKTILKNSFPFITTNSDLHKYKTLIYKVYVHKTFVAGLEIWVYLKVQILK